MAYLSPPTLTVDEQKLILRVTAKYPPCVTSSPRRKTLSSRSSSSTRASLRASE